MSASARVRASQKYKSRLSLQRGGYGPHTGTPMSGAERARRFRERRKADAARNFSAAANLASTSNTGIPALMDVTNEQTAANFENIADNKMIGYNTLTEVASARRNLHKMSVVESGDMPYSLKLAVGYPYMITMNLDVEDGLVNGAIGTLKYIEYLTEDEQETIYGTTEVDGEPQPSTSTRIRKRVRLWLEFPNPSMGQLCRVKAKPHVMCKPDVSDLNAITIHKSQGGTFDEVVFNYDKSQQIQIVYVALSRVTSIDGLYLTNDKDDLKFYHGRGSTAPTVKDIRDEYDRMANHRLPTLSMQARAFCKRDVIAERNEDQGGYLHRRRQLILIVSASNAQSLVAHAGDIESDNILMNSDYMVISETWMNCANTVMINGFELREQVITPHLNIVHIVRLPHLNCRCEFLQPEVLQSTETYKAPRTVAKS
ncbi:uncharacterized protein TNCV_940961 [Trichonephila clavipes]|nr:uncharacterized protein TNCV_940961 [Trichonephila clavipes]